jgi:hypothetical protein
MSPTKIEIDSSSPVPAASSIAPVVKSIRVRANTERAFQVFTEGIGHWWPKSHHIGSSPMVRAIMECHIGGRCYSEQEDQPGGWSQLMVLFQAEAEKQV